MNSQFPRIVKASAYPSTGPPSRPISQEYLRRWERCSRENSYIVNHAAGFNCCTSELQERMTGHVNMLHARINKGKAPKEVSAALSNLKDLTAFHQNVSVAMGTALQHLADSLFVQMSNLILLRRDSYLDHVKNGIKPDTTSCVMLRYSDLDYSLMPLYVQQSRILPVITPPVLFPDPVRVLPSRPAGDLHRGTVPMITETVGIPVPEIRIVRLGGNLAGIEAGIVAEDVFPTPVSLNREVTSNINDNYLLCPTPSTSVIAELDKMTLEKTVNSKVIDSPCSKTFHQTPSLPSQNVSYLAVDHAHSVCFRGQPQKKGLSPCIPKRKIKDVKGVFCASQCLFAPHVPNVPNVVPSLAVGGRLQKFWQVWLSLGANPRVVSILQEGYTLPFKIRPPLTRSPVIKSGYAHPDKSKALYQAVTDLINKLLVEKVIIRSSLAFYNRLFLVPKPNQRWRPILDLSHLNLFLKPGTFKMETPETIRLSLQKGEWVTSLDFSDAYFHIPISQRSRKYLRFFLGRKAYQFTALPFGLATAPLEFTKVVKEVKLMAQARGIRIHQYLDDWLVRAPDQETCQLHTQTLLALCHEQGWVVNMEKSELTPQQVFNFVGYRFDLLSGRVLPTQDRWIALRQKLQFIKGRNCCSVRQFMSLIGLLTATEKQVWAGRLHMRPVQWHLKRHWHVPESLEKIIPVPLSLHPHLEWWLDETNVLKGQPLHPLQHALQIFTDASNEGWGAHLGGSIARGVWSEPESRLHINFLELKAVLLALRSFEKQCRGQIVLIATDNTTVVSYINKEGGMKSGSLCALLWRLLAWCHPRKIILRARHIPGRLNVIADKLSRHNQVIQTEWCLSQQVFNRLCSNWGQPQIDLFATRFNHKLPKFVSPVPDSTAWAVDALSLPWSNLDVYTFPPVSLLNQVTSKLVNQGFHRMILIAPGWPNMPWFWDLISLSSQIPFSLPLERNLLTQPFNGLLHRNLNHLNLHAWLLEPRPSGDKGFLRRWQQELKLLREVQPERSISQSGPFLLSGATPTRWTSGRPL